MAGGAEGAEGWQELLCPPSWSGGDGGERSPARLSGASRGREAEGRASPRYGGSGGASRLPPVPLREPPPRCCPSRACPGLAPAPLRERGAAGAPQAAPGSREPSGPLRRQGALTRAPLGCPSRGRAWRAAAGGCRGPGRGGEGPGRAGGSGARPPPAAALGSLSGSSRGGFRGSAGFASPAPGTRRPGGFPPGRPAAAPGTPRSSEGGEVAPSSGGGVR